jgi:hypothetical protein
MKIGVSGASGHLGNLGLQFGSGSNSTASLDRLARSTRPLKRFLPAAQISLNS